jgi:hypothetical protein
MTPQEQDMIADLIDRVQNTQLDEKDSDAEQMLQQGLGRTPNALYILVQTVLVQKYALDQAQSQLAQAKDQIQQLQQHPEPKHATSFLGNLLGRNQEQPAPPPPPYAQVSTPGYGYAPTPGYGAPPAMGGGGFLQNAMQTAAGVAAGALAFQGIESLMHGFGHAAGYGNASGFGGFGGAEGRPVENVVNNYYGDDKGGHEEHGSHEVSSAERELGNQEDYSAKSDSNDRDTLYSANDDTDTESNSGDDVASFDDDNSNDLDDTSDNFDDSGSDFDDGSDGGDDNNFA